MKHRVNLYTAEFAPTYTLLSLNSLLFFIVSLAALLAIISMLTAWHGSSMKTEVQTLQAQASELQTAVDFAQQALANRQPDPKLLANIENQKVTLSQRQRLLQELAKRETVKNNRFSQVLSDLSKADTPSVWLTTIHVSDELINLQGFGTEADAMPKWLSKLSLTPSFRGTDFQQVTMLREDRGLFFTLQTELREQAAGGQAQ